jgi:short-subunit dehydrogenase
MTNTETILVTGASSGIGNATAKLLLGQGHTVIGIARNFSKAGIEHAQFIPVTLDLSDLKTLPAALEELAGQYEITCLICNAGQGRFGSLEEFSYRQIQAMIELNLVSPVYCARAILPGMKQRGRGRIVFIGSEAALQGGKRGAVYASTKFGLRGMAQSLRQECASSNIDISIINPGMVKTEFFKGLDFAPGESAENHLLPEDVAEVILHVLSSRPGTVIDEINLSPRKKVILSKQPDKF